MRSVYTLFGAAFILIAIGAFYLLRHQNRVENDFDTREQTRPTAVQGPLSNTAKHMLSITSPEFFEGGAIPPKYTCDGENTNPTLEISGVPEGVRSLVLIMDDPDIPDSVKERMQISVFDHWVLFNIPVSSSTITIAENSIPAGGRTGNNSSGKLGYTGPCPPDREHRYFWKLYALDTVLELKEGATREEVERAMEGHVVDTSTLRSTYARVAH